ncbi:transcription repressor NadR [Metabacillus iocasae]|uniref:Transcriptional regulator of NAD metabolism n=1 Tax=Priestia iocasae TaxID=2291674 RepID=A0ABS2QPK4_9BACI|nr:transcription repressor NadR [Metabacillus iocasae]MBM7701380.1 transcriptional regulator of NAD metabolism [Metabacillus iocasae]
MKEQQKKVLGEERRLLILSWLKEQGIPLTGSELSKRTNVSRQVIVQDISLLKARNEPIVATSQGYLYLSTKEPQQQQRIIACHHGPDETELELMMLVDHGVRVKDVIVEHPVYGEITASIMVSTRKEVEHFLANVKHTNATYLSQLTEGTHLHTIEADSTFKLDAACHALKKAGFLIEI